MGYCRSCRIGTFDAEGLCVLCGASQTPPTRRQRVAEASGTVVAALLSPLVLLLGSLGLLLVVLSRYGAQAPARVPGLPGTVAGGAGATALGLIGPAILQSIVLLLLVIVVLLVMRRRRGRPESLSAGEHRHPLWS